MINWWINPGLINIHFPGEYCTSLYADCVKQHFRPSRRRLVANYTRFITRVSYDSGYVSNAVFQKQQIKETIIRRHNLCQLSYRTIIENVHGLRLKLESTSHSSSARATFTSQPTGCPISDWFLTGWLGLYISPLEIEPLRFVVDVLRSWDWSYHVQNDMTVPPGVTHFNSPIVFVTGTVNAQLISSCFEI